MSKRLRLAVALNLAVHGPLVMAARHRLSYDAYVHMFFADHYRRDWWGLWESRWYGGFSVASYPPLVHQLIAALSRLVGLEVAYAALLLAVLAAMPLAVYGFARVFVGRRSSANAALLGAILPGVAVAAHAFGQLPTLAGLLAALLAFATLDRYLRYGRGLDGALLVALTTVAGAVHHGTLLLLPLGGAAVVVHGMATGRVALRRGLARLAGVLPAALAALALVVWPFWRWGWAQTMQRPIDHASRHSFVGDPPASALFFWALYGPLLLAVGAVPWAVAKRKQVTATVLFGLLFVVGLGGTTPLPRWLFGHRWAWLTYDRFTLWAGTVLLVVAGSAVSRIEAAVLARWSRSWRSRAAGTALILGALTSVLIAVSASGQPPRVDLEPMVRFLAHEDRSDWRYVTFGLGDQMAWLSVLTEAETIDGSYHTARRIPELRESGIGKIDTATWATLGLEALDPILDRAGERGVRWGFVSRQEYEPVLERHGWYEETTLENGIGVWVNPDAVRPPASDDAPTSDPLAAFSWGLFPLLALGVTGALAAARRWEGRWTGLRRARALASRALRRVHWLAVGTLPLALSFWTYRTVLSAGGGDAYFIYTDVLVYASDALALAAVLAWAGSRLLAPGSREVAHAGGLTWVLSTLVALAAVSVVWSQAPVASVYGALHLVLMLGLYLTLVDDRVSWRFAAVGACAALGLQAGVAIAEFSVQSTAFLAPLGLTWPGSLGAEMRGVSVVELADGTRWLRAHGTLPHPNILGGWLIALLAGPLAFFVEGRRRRLWALGLVAAGVVALMLSFSRSAWLGAATGAAVLLYHIGTFKLSRLAAVGALALALVVTTVVPLHDLFRTRLTDFAVHTEARSLRERRVLGQEAASLIRERPLLGTGFGAFVPALAANAPPGTRLEPDHNVPRLVTAELGVAGGMLVVAAIATIVQRARKAADADEVVLSAALLGLLVAALFDHYTWTLPPGRTVLWLMLGLWAGQTGSQRPGGRVSLGPAAHLTEAQPRKERFP